MRQLNTLRNIALKRSIFMYPTKLISNKATKCINISHIKCLCIPITSQSYIFIFLKLLDFKTHNESIILFFIELILHRGNNLITNYIFIFEKEDICDYHIGNKRYFFVLNYFYFVTNSTFFIRNNNWISRVD